MLLIILLFIINLVNSDNNTLSQLQNPNKANETLKLHNIKTQNVTKIVSEGGIGSTEGISLALPKENNIALLNLDKELGKSKEKPSVPRKGVILDIQPDNNNTIHQPLISSSIEKPNNVTQNETNESSKKNGTVVGQSASTNITQHKHVPSSFTPTKTKGNDNNKTIASIISQNKTDEPIIMKPLYTSYDALANSYKLQQNTQLKDTTSDKITSLGPAPSSETVVQDQLQSPNSNLNKMHNASSHPGIIMPLVLTILVVPVFALFAYMALRRGHEAWKNRHYKRMDFLLDGMYNE